MKPLWQWTAVSVMVLCGCNAPETEETAVTVQPANIDWSSVTHRHIVFGHQSVGANLLNGVETLARRDGVNLPVRNKPDAPGTAGITHFNIGRNEDPYSKMQAFSAAMDAGAAAGADVALMKLCYVDFNANTDSQQVADAYISNLDTLSLKYPGTTFVAITAPLATVQTGPKAWIKRLLGKQPAQYLENGKRAEFNELIRKHYQSDRRLFDLARIESSGNGNPTTVRVGDRDVEALDPALTYDGGHLNSRGEILVASAFLRFIGTLPGK